MKMKMAAKQFDSHNRSVIQTARKGDLLEFERSLYSHWAVYIGNEEVVHLAGIENGINSNNINPSHVFTICGRQFNKAMVKRERVWDVLIDSKVKINNDKDRKCQPLEPIKIVEEAISKVGEIGYNLLWDNCEHFAAYCRYGIKWSEQVRNLGILVGTYWMMPYVSLTALSTLYVWKKILARKDKEKMKSRL